MQARFAPVGIEVIYAIPYNAQAKLIERMFRTFRHRFDEDFAAYRGMLGERSEFARELYNRPSELPTRAETNAATSDTAESQRTADSSLCVASTRTPTPRLKPPGRRCDGALRYAEIAAKLGKSRSTLDRYIRGVLPWPAGLRERFEYYARLRSGEQTPLGEPPPEPLTLRTRRSGGDTYRNIAKALGVSRESLRKYRMGAWRWPEGMRERFEELERRR